MCITKYKAATKIQSLWRGALFRLRDMRLNINHIFPLYGSYSWRVRNHFCEMVEVGDCVFLGGKHPIEWTKIKNEGNTICDWCQKYVEYSGKCIMGCDFDVCQNCYNFKRGECLKNFIIFGEHFFSEENE